jgi:hypothetical protein
MKKEGILLVFIGFIFFAVGGNVTIMGFEMEEGAQYVFGGAGEVIIGIIMALFGFKLLATDQREKKGKKESKEEVAAPEITKLRDVKTTPEEKSDYRPMVLVICPYCTTKVEQGITICTGCGAKL